ncbi:hypothetical protein M406DRAFT_354206, partial [Cryphonectria parasitica EP155]
LINQTCLARSYTTLPPCGNFFFFFPFEKGSRRGEEEEDEARTRRAIVLYWLGRIHLSRLPKRSPFSLRGRSTWRTRRPRTYLILFLWSTIAIC